MDISSGLNAHTLGPDCLKPATAIARALRDQVPAEHILMSSDGYGSAARYDDQGHVEGLVASDPHTLAAEFRDLVLEERIPLATALLPVSRNVAQAYSLHPAKGELAPGSDSDLLVWSEDLRPQTLFARGRLMLRDGKALVRGTFED